MPLQLVTPPVGEPLHLLDALAHIKQDQGIDDAHVAATITSARKIAENRTWRQLLGARYAQVLDSFPGIGQFGVPWGKAYTRPGNAIYLERAPIQVVESITYLAMDGSTQTVDPATYTVDYTSEPCRITPVFGKIWPIPLPQIGAVSVKFIAGFAAPIAIDTTADTITVRGPWKAQQVGDPVRFTNSGGALPAPLQLETDYYIESVVAAGVYTLAATPGGAKIDLTDVGAGASFIGEVPADILAWIRMRIGSLDQFREEVAIMSRGKIDELPFVDGLLDSYAPWW